MKSGVRTAFAPSERSSARRIAAEYRAVSAHFLNDPRLRIIIDSVLEVVVILDGNRQVVFSNGALHRLLGIENGESIRGLRPGELLHCKNAVSCAGGGCGTSEFCRTCGALKAIMSAQTGIADAQECSIVREGEYDSLDLAVSTSPLDIKGERYTMFAAIDISDRKRRLALERIFFHDVLNTVGVISGFSEILKAEQVRGASAERMGMIGEKIHFAVRRLVDEIRMQQQLSRAENDELEVQLGKVNSKKFIDEVAEIYRHHGAAREKTIAVSSDVSDVVFDSDLALLRRIVGNMVKNALEASAENEAVTVGCRVDEDEIEFWVHNNGFMPEEVQMQVFKRSFTTKGNGRGLGTYSMKLLSETYLGGTVSFKSSPEAGTTFLMRCPLSAHSDKSIPDIIKPEHILPTI